MKKISFFFAGALLLFAATAFRSAGPGTSANGQGGLDFGGKKQQFSFHATTDAAGNVSGSFEIKSPTQDLRLHGTISCLQVLPDGKTAYMSGTITQRVGDGFPGNYLVGNAVYFKVADNGEGNNSTADQFSDIFELGSAPCANYSLILNPIVNGNIQVKP